LVKDLPISSGLEGRWVAAEKALHAILALQ
jgi:hypothetical protein